MTESILLQPTGVLRLFLRSFKIYLLNLPTLLILGIILLLPASLILGIAALLTPDTKNPVRILFCILGLIAFQAVFFYWYAAATLAVSLDLTGLKATVIQILRRIGGRVGVQLFGTGLLQALILYGGFILFIIPGFVWGIRYCFALPIVVLERRAYKSAFRRSRELVDGSWWRLFGAFLIATFGFYVIVFLLGTIIYIPLVLSGVQQDPALGWACSAFYFAMPVLFIYPVLLYYDMRVRKEAFNVQTIREAV